MKIALIGDTHFGARNDSSHFDDSFRRFYETCFFPTLEDNNIKHIVHMGDVFDRRKFINFNILKSCKEYFFEPLKQQGITMDVIPGNHDVYFKNTNAINSLDLLVRPYDNITIHEQVTSKQIGGRNVTFVPWITDDNMEATVAALKKTKAPDLCVGHFEFNGFEMYRGMVCEAGISHGLVQQFSAVFTGHFHHKSSKDNVYYLGAPYEMIWSDYDDFRGFHILDLVTGDIESIQNPITMFHKVYYKESEARPKSKTFAGACVKIIVEERKDQETFDAFVEALYAADVAELTIFEDFSEYDALTRTDEEDKIEDTLTLLVQFIDAAEDDANTKEKLKSIIKKLYIEAQHIDEAEDD